MSETITTADPRELIIGTNVRLDAHTDKGFLASTESVASSFP